MRAGSRGRTEHFPEIEAAPKPRATSQAIHRMRRRTTPSEHQDAYRQQGSAGVSDRSILPSEPRHLTSAGKLHLGESRDISGNMAIESRLIIFECRSRAWRRRCGNRADAALQSEPG